MKKYEPVKIETILPDAEDVITTSEGSETETPTKP